MRTHSLTSPPDVRVFDWMRSPSPPLTPTTIPVCMYVCMHVRIYVYMYVCMQLRGSVFGSRAVACHSRPYGVAGGLCVLPHLHGRLRKNRKVHPPRARTHTPPPHPPEAEHGCIRVGGVLCAKAVRMHILSRYEHCLSQWTPHYHHLLYGQCQHTRVRITPGHTTHPTHIHSIPPP